MMVRLTSKAAYDADLLNKVNEAQLVDMVTAKRIILGETVEGASRSANYRVEYKSIEKGMQPSFFVLARRLGIMADVKAGVPRTAYLGILQLNLEEKRVLQQIHKAAAAADLSLLRGIKADMLRHLIHR